MKKKRIEVDIEVNRKIEAARLSFGESENAILRRLLGIDAKPVPSAGPRVRLPRSSGAYSILLGTHPVEANSLKDLLRRTILLGERMAPGLVGQLAATPTARGRFIVAQRPEGLYPRSPQLVEYAERLDDAWWFDTNLGRKQVAKYLATIAEMLKLDAIPTIMKRSEQTAVSDKELGL